MRGVIAGLALALGTLICGVAGASGALHPNVLVAQAGDLRGFGPARVQHFSTTSTSEWAEVAEESSPAAARENKVLLENGFQLGLLAFFIGRREAHGRHREAVSDALVLATAADAQKELGAQVAEAAASYQKRGLKKGTMRSISGSVTLGAFTPGRPGATGNVFFRVGRCVFVIGDAVHDASTRAAAADPSRAAAIAVAGRVRPYCG
jgi:hypothetical protein